MIRPIYGLYRDAFSGLNRSVWVLCLANLVNRSGTMVLPFLSLYLTQARGQSPTEAGLAMSFYGAGAMGGAYLGGWLCDRIPPIQVQIGSLLLTALAFLMLCVMRSTTGIIATMVFLSVVGEAFRPANASSIAEAAHPETSTRAFALNRMAINLGMTIGPVTGGFLVLLGWAWLFLVDAATCILAAVILARALTIAAPAHATPHRAPAADRSPWRDGLFLATMALSTISGILFFQLLVAFPLTLSEQYGFSTDRIGLVLATNTVVIILFEMVLTHAAKGLDPLKVIAWGSLFIGAGFAMLPLGSGFGFVAITVLVWTVGEMLSMPFMGGFVANRAGPKSRGRYMGLYVLSFSTAFMIAPLAGTWVYEHHGYRTLWYSCAPIGFLLFTGFWLCSAILKREQGALQESTTE